MVKVMYLMRNMLLAILICLSGCDLYSSADIPDSSIVSTFHANEPFFLKLVDFCKARPDIDWIYSDGRIIQRNLKKGHYDLSGFIGFEDEVLDFLNDKDLHSFSCDYWFPDGETAKFVGITVAFQAYGLSLGGGGGKALSYDQDCLARFPPEEKKQLRMLGQSCWFIYDFH